MTTSEKRSALALYEALHPKLDADAFRAAAQVDHGEIVFP